MGRTQTKSLSVLAPAKINLYLHVIGKREDGLHLLDSIIMFADQGDEIRIKTARQFSFLIDGPFANAFTDPERDGTPLSKNLAVQAAYKLAKTLGKDLNFDLCLTKNLPLAAGIGGGSADAAAVIRALLKWWNTPPASVPGFNDLLLSLGADVPACMVCEPIRIGGIGEQITPLNNNHGIPIVLVNPGQHCATAKIFKHLNGHFSPEAPEHGENLLTFFQQQRNDLTTSAISLVPEIGNVLNTIQAQPGCLLSRMSGSGATCFGLFPSEFEASNAATEITRQNPDWWVIAGTLNRKVQH